MVLLVLFTGMAFAQEGFDITVKYENYSYNTYLVGNPVITQSQDAWWHMTRKLEQLTGRESVSRIIFQPSYSTSWIKAGVIFGFGRISCDYNAAETVKEYGFPNLGVFSYGEKLKPFSGKSELGFVYGGELEFILHPGPLSMHLRARYIRQEESSNPQNILFDYGEGAGFLAFSSWLQRADIENVSLEEMTFGISLSGKIGNWILSGGPMALFLKTTHKGLGITDQRSMDLLNYHSFRLYLENEFEFKVQAQVFFFNTRVGYQMNSTEVFVEAKIGGINGIAAGLKFRI